MLVEGGEERIANRRKEKRGGVPEREQHTIFMNRVSKGRGLGLLCGQRMNGEWMT